MKSILFITVFLLCIPLFSQNIFSTEEFQEDEIKNLLIDSLNTARELRKLHPLETDEVLEAAAFEQAEYLMEQEEFNHNQENSKFKTLEKRVEYFGGLYAGLGENIFTLLTHKEGRRRKNNLSMDSYSSVVSAIIDEWEKNKKTADNLYDHDFFRIGVEVFYDSVNKQMAVVSVFGTEPYPTRDGLKPVEDYGLKVYDRNACDKILREYPALPELLGSSVHVVENKVWLEDIDRNLLQKAINSSSDGLAADLICEDQFPCKGGNKLYPGEIHDGYLLKPVRKHQLNAGFFEKEGETHFLLGEIPSAFHSLQCEADILLIKENSVCAVAPFNHFGGKNISWLNIGYEFSFLEDSLSKSSWIDTLEFSFHPEDNKTSVFKRLDSILSYFHNIEPHIVSAEAQIYYSPIQAKREKAESWKTALNDKLESYSYHEVIAFSEKIAWDEYTEYTENRVYSLETQKLDSLQLTSYLKAEYKKDDQLRIFLDSLNRINLKIVKRNSWKTKSNNDLIKMYSFFVQNSKPDLALKVQQRLIESNRAVDIQKLIQIQLPLKKKYSDIANNQLLLKIKAGLFEQNKGKTVKQSFGEILFADPNNKKVEYNYLVSILREWTRNLKSAKGIDEWLKSFNRVRGSKLMPDSNLTMLLLNYHILAADHFYENAMYEERKDELDKVVEIISSLTITEKEANYYAEYLMFQLQIPSAIKLLKPFAVNEHPMEKTLRNILSISIYGYEILSQSEKNEIHRKYSALYPEAYCKLFGADAMGVQMLNNPAIKTIYCDTCQ